MGLDLWFREDVARILAGNYATMLATMAEPMTLEQRGYVAGFEAALHSVAIAFGVATPGRTAYRGTFLIEEGRCER